jgi:integrase
MNDVLTTTFQAVKMKASTEGPVFRTSQGGPYRNFRTAFERAVQQAGLEDFTFHDLWHTFASRLVMAGVDLTTVKEVLGHKGICHDAPLHAPIDRSQAACSQCAGAVRQQRPRNFPHNA